MDQGDGFGKFGNRPVQVHTRASLSCARNRSPRVSAWGRAAHGFTLKYPMARGFLNRWSSASAIMMRG